MSGWLKAAILALELTGAFVRWIEREKLADDIERELLRQAKEKIDANVSKADAARARVRAELNDDPGRLRDAADPFRRSD